SRTVSAVTSCASGLPGSESLVGQDLDASGPKQNWEGDIAYLRTDEGLLYLAVVIDLWSRAVIGWSMSPRMTAQLACDALQMALWRRSEEHTSELQSRFDLVCRLLLEKKKV